ncbi:hypothetical protein TWF694_009237 [Orbilia ellipsospora]|uniref:Lariat debranching enzyme C-terminal domain-containing protein n=1 Tax=Orbilia ellipsospora TaxID=2528407 RepID=A0AAV9XHN6_9PEZI
MDPEPPISTSSASQAPPAPEMVFSKGLRVAIQGCGHGMLDGIYATIEQACHLNDYTVDLLIICGDFQAVRNSRDLLTMACPPKYRHMGDFYKYYNGSKTAPIPTLFIGGNHEASTHLWELNHGGWVCPNIYYMGCTGVVNINGIRIAGISGIYNEGNYKRPRFEKPPYDDRSVRGAYHYRAHELFRLNMLSGDVDIFVSHDWPEGITKYGNERRLLQWKQHFRAEVAANTLGAPPLMGVLRKVKPRYWFAAHMHVKFAALVDHEEGPRTEAPIDPTDWTDVPEMIEATKNEDEIDLDMEDVDVSETSEKQPAKPAETTSKSSGFYEQYPSAPTTNKRTHFLALDKLLPRRDFLQILTIPSRNPLPVNDPLRTRLQYDREWLAVVRAFDGYDVSSGVGLSQFMKIARTEPQVNKKMRVELTWVNANITDEQLVIPENWERTADLQYDDHTKASKQLDPFNNPQTESFCKMISITNKYKPAPYVKKSPPPGASGSKMDLDSTVAEGSGSATRTKQ